MLQLQVAAERGKRKTKLQESEERYRSLANVAFDGVAVHFGGILLQVTQSFDRLFGYAFGDTLGRSIYEMVIEEQRDYFKRELHKGSVFELECLREDGRHIYVEASTCACTFKGEPADVLAVRDISARKREHQAARHQADYDSLTGLPNRMLFYDRFCVAIEQAAREGRCLAVMFLDLDRFKNVNDALGHNIGDVLLFEVAERLTACLGEGGTASRLGGDEFTVLLREITGSDDAMAVADKIVKSVNRPYVILGQSVSVGVSVGIAMYPEHGQQADSLIRAADAAMYHAKDAGRNNFQLYGPEKAGKQDKLGLENRLRMGIEHKEFMVYYQPKIDLASGELEGAEALVRWRHPERGLVMPDDFIPMAEETRLILPLGALVMFESCRQAKIWEASGIKISINLSPWQLYDPSLIDTIDEALRMTGVRPAMVDFEITETAAMKNMGQALSVLQALISRGFSVSLDDFGKGYSSLAYLKKFPVSTIKIDMSFVRDVLKESKDAAIVQAIITLGHNFGMKVLAEGVEETAQADYLKQEGCDLAQGYLYSRPVGVEAFEDLYPAVRRR